MKIFNYIINNKFISQTHPIQGETEIGDLSQDVLRFPKIVDGQVILDVEAKEAFEQTSFNNSKTAKLSESSSKFDSLMSSYRGVITLNLIVWDSGQKYKNNCDITLREISKSNVVSPVTWRANDNTFYSLSEIELQALSDAIESDLYNQGIISYTDKWNYENQINSCSTIEEVEAIEINYQE